MITKYCENTMPTELRKRLKSKESNQDEIGCSVCHIRDSELLTLQRCAGCKIHYYCSKACQARHWKSGGHMGECKQLKLLKEYHRPYAKQIRNGTIRGEYDNIAHSDLQTLRKKLGLTRPIEDSQGYDEQTHSGDEMMVARNDGTVCIPSTSDVI